MWSYVGLQPTKTPLHKTSEEEGKDGHSTDDGDAGSVCGAEFPNQPPVFAAFLDYTKHSDAQRP